MLYQKEVVEALVYTTITAKESYNKTYRLEYFKPDNMIWLRLHRGYKSAREHPK